MKPWRVIGLMLLISGCSTAVNSGISTALSGDDLVRMTDDMAAKIVADADVQAAIAQHGALKVVIQPVENAMTAEVLPRGPAEAFTARVRALLSKHAPDRFTWIMNRDAFYRLRKQELEGVDLGPAPDAINPQYALTARFSSLTSETAKNRSSYYLCNFQLTDLQNRTILWTGSYEVKKQAVKEMLD
jgi:hypothetical protein